MKNTLLMGLLWAAVLAISPVGAEERDDAGESSLAVPFTVLEEGTRSGVLSQRFEVIRDEESLIQLWLGHTALASPPPEAPVVDFEQEQVIAVFLGSQPTGGYRIEVTSIEEALDSLVVNVKATFPGPSCTVTLAETRPYQLVLLPQMSGNPIVAFQTAVAREDCPASSEPPPRPRKPRRPQ